MKKTNKILLSVLAIFSLFLNVNVNAEEIQNEESTNNQVKQTNLESTKTVNSIEDVKKFIPDSIELDIKSVDLFSTEYSYYIAQLESKVSEKIDKIFRDNVEFTKETVTGTYGNSYEQENFFVNGVKMYYAVGGSYETGDINTVTVTVYERKEPSFYSCSSEEDCAEKDIEKTVQFRKNIKIKYSNSDQYNEEDKKYITSIVNSSEFKNAIEGIVVDTVSDVDTVIEYVTNYLTKIINDNSLKIIVEGIGMSGGGDYQAMDSVIAIAKNDIVYEIQSANIYGFNEIIVPEETADTDEAYINYALPKLKEIWSSYNIEKVEKLNDEYVLNYDFAKLKNNGTFYKLYLSGGNCTEGEECYARAVIRKENSTKISDNVIINNNSGITINGTIISSEDDIYTEMLNLAKEKGFTNVFGSYEFKIMSGSINDKLTLTFTLGTDYNGKYALVLHKKADGSYEEFSKVIENGKVEIEVSELSPFMVLINDTAPNTAPNNAQTASMNIVFYSLTAIISLLGIAYIIIKSRKKEA